MGYGLEPPLSAPQIMGRALGEKSTRTEWKHNRDYLGPLPSAVLVFQLLLSLEALFFIWPQGGANPHNRSDQISLSVVSDSLGPHESQHARPPCPSPAPGVHSDSRPSSQ